MTTLKKLPTTAMPTRMRITGIRIAQTRGGKRSWSGWPSSTNGCYTVSGYGIEDRGLERERRAGSVGGRAYNKQCPDGIVEEHSGCDEKHHQAGKLGELFADTRCQNTVSEDRSGFTYHDLFERTQNLKQGM